MTWTRYYRRAGEQVRTHRNARGITQEQLGLCLRPPCGRANIANIEGGKQSMPLHVAKQIADALGVSISRIAGVLP